MRRVNSSMTLRATSRCQQLMFMQGGGSTADLPRVPLPANMISFDFEQFGFRLLSSAQSWMCVSFSSLVLVPELTDSTIT